MKKFIEQEAREKADEIMVKVCAADYREAVCEQMCVCVHVTWCYKLAGPLNSQGVVPCAYQTVYAYCNDKVFGVSSKQ